MRILVTGSSGQIGSYVVDVAREQGHETIGLDLRPSGWTDVVGDVRDVDTVEKTAAGCDTVIHLAAQVSVQGSIEDPLNDASQNVIGTIGALEGARRASVRRFVYTSSAAVYGTPARLPIHENDATAPLSPYGASKLAGETYTQLYDRMAGLEAIVVRPFNVYSARQDPRNPYSGVLSKFVSQAKLGQPLVIFGDGHQTRDFVHAQDVARWMITIATSKTMDARCLNLASGTETSIRDLATAVIEARGAELTIQYESARPGEIRRSVANVERLARLSPSRIGLAEGITSMLHSG